jgi:hypothetical protein
MVLLYLQLPQSLLNELPGWLKQFIAGFWLEFTNWSLLILNISHMAFFKPCMEV